MPPHSLTSATSPSSASSKNLKRAIDDAADDASAGASTTNFRNVSACNRCRNRKNRCDQKLPKCTNCLKANVRCVGFDPVSKREIPRSYVYYLETRVNNLEAILRANGVSYPPPSDDFAISESIKPGINVPYPVQDDDGQHAVKPEPTPEIRPTLLDPALKERDASEGLSKLVDNIGVVSVHGNADSQLLGATSGISFARVVFAAVKKSTNNPTSTPSDRGGSKPLKPSSADMAGGGTTMRDSFFGLHSKPTIKEAPFPEKELGLRLTELYFEHANPQIPVLHRGEYMSLFERVYATEPKKRTPRELYMLNIVFAIGSGIIMDSSSVEQTMSATESSTQDSEPPSKKRVRLASYQHQPEEYHASAIVHLESFLGSSPAAEGVGGGLEELQAVLLLAGLALLRPVAPGLWYIIGVAVRLSIDLGLHFEDIDHELDSKATHSETQQPVSKGAGRKQWTRDLRRRLWWCVFNLDRLVSSCVGRPVSINESVVTTEFPSMLDDSFISPSGFLEPPNSEIVPSYKLVSRHYIRLRLLQSEILQVLQFRQADQARKNGALRSNDFVPSHLESPFLRKFRSFRDWRADVDQKLKEWKDTAPQPLQTGVAFNPLFLELNYWQAIIMLYRPSLSVPEPLASELSPATGEDVQSPGAVNLEREEDKQIVFLKVAQAGQTVLKIYRQLHRLKLVNYTFLATHHLFMSGISFLYAIWHSATVRGHLTIDDVDFTVLAATSVLHDLVETCPPAEACRDAFVRMSKATISMVMSTTGFGQASTLGTQPLTSNPEGYFGNTRAPQEGGGPDLALPSSPSGLRQPLRPRRQIPKFDMNLKDLFSEEEIATHHLPRTQIPPLPNQQPAGLQNILQSRRRRDMPQHQEHQQQQQQPVASPPPPGPLSTHVNPTSPPLPFSLSPPVPHQQLHQPPQPAHPPFDQGLDPSSSSSSCPPLLDLDFLHDFSVADPSTGYWGLSAGLDLDLDLGLDLDRDLGWGSGSAGGGGGGAGGGFDSSGAWEANGRVFDEFFFGAEGGGAAGAGGGGG